MKILTIDFDIIMGPTIELYNNMVGGPMPMDTLENYYPLLKFCSADLIMYENLTNFLITAACQMPFENIKFIMNHADVVKFLPENEKVSIMNIDHHHDLGYPNNPPELNCGNWVDYLFENNLCDGLTWVKNGNSANIPPKYHTHDLIQELDIPEVDIVYELIKPDMIIICGSFEWIPTQFRPLFFLWRDIISGIHQQEHVILQHIPPFENN